MSSGDPIVRKDRIVSLSSISPKRFLQFEEIPGPIPNRGLLQRDIKMFGPGIFKGLKIRSSKIKRLVNLRDFTLNPVSGPRSNRHNIPTWGQPSFAWPLYHMEQQFSHRAQRCRLRLGLLFRK